MYSLGNYIEGSVAFLVGVKYDKSTRSGVPFGAIVIVRKKKVENCCRLRRDVQNIRVNKLSGPEAWLANTGMQN